MFPEIQAERANKFERADKEYQSMMITSSHTDLHKSQENLRKTILVKVMPNG